MSNNQDILNSIANQHLGKAGDGSVVKPYVTPDNIDKSLLVAIPRYLNRTDYGIDDKALPFVGVDVWNAYEVSALTDNGFPVTGIAKIVYPSDSPSIVESKSIKLYLNSFNMDKLGATVQEVKDRIVATITADLSEALETNVVVSFFSATDEVHADVAKPVGFDRTVECEVDVASVVFDRYNEDPEILQYKDITGKRYALKCGLLRSNCRVTNQPDWGTLFVRIEGASAPTYESLLQYIVSMRKENHFHEEVVECFFKRLYDALPGARILVGALYTRRGGIDINPIRATDAGLVLDHFSGYIDKNTIASKTLNQ